MTKFIKVDIEKVYLVNMGPTLFFSCSFLHIWIMVAKYKENPEPVDKVWHLMHRQGVQFI